MTRIKLAVGLILVVIFAACEIIAPHENPEDVITLVNRTGKPLIYMAYELEDSHLVDPNLHFKVGPNQERLLQPGESITLTSQEIQGDYRPGDDVRFFLWEVTNGEAELKGMLTLTYEELRQRDFRVEISRIGASFSAALYGTTQEALFTLLSVSPQLSAQ